ncbi:response regulator [Brevibacillus sp. HB1.4B]|uniref:response regulator n=2 Tax=Brevibacillus TaxID=55080 RepID=UPI00156B9D7D|nr:MULTISPECIES: response regulator [unclassified Brevibacillus]NRS17848.1 response regulator [Brevibacillus sp. HB1.4B]NTU31804.1 response regulator [Brevibacillus sp. HB1.1]
MSNEVILLVEDDENIRELVRLYLQASGFQVREAEDMRQAQAMVLSEQLDMVLLDILLPDGSGLELCQTWRQSGIHVPVLFLSCKNDTEDMIAGLDLGGDDYVTKPFDPNLLISRVKAHLRRRSIQGENSKALLSPKGLIETLTKRELEMLHMIKAGYTNQEIALQYQISIGTVKGYNNQLFSKLGAKNRTHAIMLASQFGFFT